MIFLMALLAATALGLPGPSAAAAPPKEAITQQGLSTTAPAESEADLILMNRHVVRFRSSLLGSPASQRAERGERNLAAILARDEDDEVKVQHNQMGNIFLVGWSAGLHPQPRRCGQAQRRDPRNPHPHHPGQAAPGNRRNPREPRQRSHGPGCRHCRGCTAVALIVALVLSRLHKGVGGRLVSAIDSKAERLRLGGAELIRRDRILAAVGWLMNAGYWLLVLLLAYAWLGFVLARFPFTRVWGEQLNGYLLGIAVDLGKGILTTLPNLLIAAIMFLLARGVVGLLNPCSTMCHQVNPASAGWTGTRWNRPARSPTS